jgi:hypothetical protein
LFFNQSDSIHVICLPAIINRMCTTLPAVADYSIVISTQNERIIQVSGKLNKINLVVTQTWLVSRTGRVTYYSAC